MNKSFAFLFFLVLISFSCKQHKKNVNPYYVSSDEAEITTLGFNACVTSDTIFKKKLTDEDFSESQSAFTTEYIEQQKRELDTLKRKLDTAKIYVLIADTLIRLPKDFLKSEIKSLDSSRKKTEPIDTVLNNWAQEINIDEAPGKFYLKNLAFKYGYTYLLKSKLKIWNGKLFVANTFKTSSVFFNKNRTKAFIYAETYCGWACGAGYNIYFLKRNGKWIIVKKERQWIS